MRKRRKPNPAVQGAIEALAYVEGKLDPATYRVHVPSSVNVAKVRKKTNLSQARFAARFGFNLATLRAWERKARQPEGPARVLLTIIDREPQTVERILQKAS